MLITGLDQNIIWHSAYNALAFPKTLQCLSARAHHPILSLNQSHHVCLKEFRPDIIFSRNLRCLIARELYSDLFELYHVI